MTFLKQNKIIVSVVIVIIILLGGWLGYNRFAVSPALEGKKYSINLSNETVLYVKFDKDNKVYLDDDLSDLVNNEAYKGSWDYEDKTLKLSADGDTLKFDNMKRSGDDLIGALESGGASVNVTMHRIGK
ncbi:hypothetical protein AB0Y21_04215 [Weissella paramesenteroides]|uniref:hypothetical protein n=1 Tax=Weissella paramesenteroides TaxID=1249 RepID=UPI003F1FC8BC